MKKITVLFVILFSFYNLFADVTLNKYGHIEEKEAKKEANYYMENGEYYIEIDGIILIGNSLFIVQNGFLTLTGEHENLPTWLRIYDENGNLIQTKEFRKVINLTVSENGHFTAFFDGEYLQVLNNSTLQLKPFSRSVIFDVNNLGEPILVNDNGSVVFGEQSYLLNTTIRKVIFHNELPLVITENSIYKIRKELEKLYTLEDNVFEVKIVNNILYLVIKNDPNYRLLKFNNYRNIEQIDEINFDSSLNRIHEPIYAPLNYGEEDFPFPIGNSYAEIQQYGGSPYLHPGVDYLGDDFQEVYAVHDGFVKAILTTGGAPYWRVAISNEDLPTETQGYLYAHLNENSITVNLGDEVQAGDLLGTLYPWNYYDFTHIHFARVFCTGSQWYGDWWTTENNLFDVINIQDSIPPIFEDAIDDDRFAFRNSSGYYLDPLNLSSEFDIIVKCHDIANSNWRIDLHDLSYSLHPINDPDSTLFQQFSYVYDFDLDTYHNGSVDWMILNTIYSRDATCYSIGDYDEREYYHIITNSDGDSLITEEDADEIFDSTQFPDGDYYFKVTARDASLNATVDSMFVVFNNGVNTIDDMPGQQILLLNYPNPFNPETTISFSTKKITENTELSIYNVKGQLIKTLMNDVLPAGQHSVVWSGTDNKGKSVSSGVYFYKMKAGKFAETKKMILLR